MAEILGIAGAFAGLLSNTAKACTLTKASRDAPQDALQVQQELEAASAFLAALK